MKVLILLVCLLTVSLGPVQAETVYRWKDKDGKVHYGDRPAESAVETQKKSFNAAGASGADELPYSVRKARQDFPVTLYISSKCGLYCEQARAFLSKRGIPYAEKNPQNKEELEAFKLKTGGNVVPVLTVGISVLSGFEAAQWNNELDIAGYPKAAPYGVPTVVPASQPKQPVETTQ